MATPRIAFVASDAPAPKRAKRRLESLYEHVPEDQADVIVALGGDGVMLETLRQNFDKPVRIYGMNRGTVGFLMNEFHEADLLERVAKAETVVLHPLRMVSEAIDGQIHTALAINEVSLLRQSAQTARIRITIDDRERMESLYCDGILVSTAAGSTAYNLSAHGPIIPLGAGILAMTPISAFRPRRWRGALLPREAAIGFEVLEPAKRPVSATADSTEVRDIRTVSVVEERSISLELLYDPDHNLAERVLKEQFTP